MKSGTTVCCQCLPELNEQPPDLVSSADTSAFWQGTSHNIDSQLQSYPAWAVLLTQASVQAGSELSTGMF